MGSLMSTGKAHLVLLCRPLRHEDWHDFVRSDRNLNHAHLLIFPDVVPHSIGHCRPVCCAVCEPRGGSSVGTSKCFCALDCFREQWGLPLSELLHAPTGRQKGGSLGRTPAKSANKL